MKFRYAHRANGGIEMHEIEMPCKVDSNNANECELAFALAEAKIELGKRDTVIRELQTRIEGILNVVEGAA